MDFAGVPLRDQQVNFDIGPEQALVANQAQRSRLLATVQSLGGDQWGVQSRCAEWSVQDVVRHLVQMNQLITELMEAAITGERFDTFKTFNPKESPSEWLAKAGEEDPERTAEHYATTTARLFDVSTPLADQPEDLLCSTPAGRQPWPRAMLHGLFDSAIHERDITEPLGLVSKPDGEELEALAAYQVLLAARILCLLGQPLELGLRFEPGIDLRVQVDGASVGVVRGASVDAKLQASGDAVTVLDAMAGRGDLAEVLDGPPEAAQALSALQGLL